MTRLLSWRLLWRTRRQRWVSSYVTAPSSSIIRVTAARNTPPSSPSWWTTATSTWSSCCSPPATDGRRTRGTDWNWSSGDLMIMATVAAHRHTAAEEEEEGEGDGDGVTISVWCHRPVPRFRIGKPSWRFFRVSLSPRGRCFVVHRAGYENVCVTNCRIKYLNYLSLISYKTASYWRNERRMHTF